MCENRVDKVNRFILHIVRECNDAYSLRITIIIMECEAPACCVERDSFSGRNFNISICHRLSRFVIENHSFNCGNQCGPAIKAIEVPNPEVAVDWMNRNIFDLSQPLTKGFPRNAFISRPGDYISRAL